MKIRRFFSTVLAIFLALLGLSMPGVEAKAETLPEERDSYEFVYVFQDPRDYRTFHEDIQVGYKIISVEERENYIHGNRDYSGVQYVEYNPNKAEGFYFSIPTSQIEEDKVVWVFYKALAGQRFTEGSGMAFEESHTYYDKAELERLRHYLTHVGDDTFEVCRFFSNCGMEGVPTEGQWSVSLFGVTDMSEIDHYRFVAFRNSSGTQSGHDAHTVYTYDDDGAKLRVSDGSGQFSNYGMTFDYVAKTIEPDEENYLHVNLNEVLKSLPGSGECIQIGMYAIAANGVVLFSNSTDYICEYSGSSQGGAGIQLCSNLTWSEDGYHVYGSGFRTCDIYGDLYLSGNRWIMRRITSDQQIIPLQAEDFVENEYLEVKNEDEWTEYEGVNYRHLRIYAKGGVGDFTLSTRTGETIGVHLKFPDVAVYSGGERDGSIQPWAAYMYRRDRNENITTTYMPGKELYIIPGGDEEQGYQVKDFTVYGWLMTMESGYTQVEIPLEEFADVTDIPLTETYTWTRGKFAKKLTLKELPEEYKGCFEYFVEYTYRETDSNGNEAGGDLSGQFGLKKIVAGYSADIKDDVHMKVYLDLDEQMMRPMAEINFQIGGKTICSYTNQNGEFDNLPQVNGYYELSVPIAPAQFVDMINMEIFNGADSAVEIIPSFADYVYALIENPATEESCRQFAEALLYYGGYAQQYFDYETYWLAYDLLNPERNGNAVMNNTAPDSIQNQFAADLEEINYRNTTNAVNPQGLSLYGFSLVCQDKIGIRAYYKINAGFDASRLEVYLGDVLDGNRLTTVITSRYVIVDIPDIDVLDYNKTFVIGMGTREGEGMCVCDANVSVYYLLDKVMQNPDNEPFANLARSIYYCSVKAKEYYENKEYKNPDKDWESEVIPL